MRLFDTHCHFETTDESEIAEILRRAKDAGVERVLAVGGSEVLNDAALVAAKLGAYCALGWDRDQIGADRPAAEASRGTERVVALGEIGLDYHYTPETRKEQMALFASQLEEARARDLPVIIHTREAADDTIGLLKEIPSRGIIHSFTGTRAEAREYLDLGFFVSISGIVTFKAADNVRDTALYIPNDRILIETDSPYLAPVPMRGKVNEPAFVRHTCEALAKLKGLDADVFAELTFKNAETVLGLV